MFTYLSYAIGKLRYKYAFDSKHFTVDIQPSLHLIKDQNIITYIFYNIVRTVV